MDCRDAAGSKIPRTLTASDVYMRQYFDPLKGKTKYCFKVLAPFKEHVSWIANQFYDNLLGQFQ